MRNIYEGKISVLFLELLLLKCNENVVSFLKITQNKVKNHFFKKKVLFFLCVVATFVF